MIALACLLSSLPFVGFARVSTNAKVDPPMTLAEARQNVDPTVRWTPPNIKESENGWSIIQKISELKVKPVITKVEAFSVPGSPRIYKQERTEDFTELVNLLSQSSEPKTIARCKRALKPFEPSLKLLVEAVKRPYWYAPSQQENQVPKPFAGIAEDSFKINAVLKNLSKAIVLRARLELKLKHPQAATDDLLLCHTVADRTIESHKDLITLLVGFAIEGIADKAIQTLSASPNLRTQDLKRLLYEVQERPLRVDLVESLKSEHDRQFVTMMAGIPYPSKEFALQYGTVSNIDEQLLEGHPNPFDRKAMLQLASERYRQILEWASKSYQRTDTLNEDVSDLQKGWPPKLPLLTLQFGLDEQEPKLKDLTKAEIVTYRAQLAKIDNPQGKLFMSFMLPVFSETRTSDTRMVATSRATRIILGIQIYQRQHNKVPLNLTSLVESGILKGVPIDPFDGKSFRYDPVRKVIWSVGPNQKDDGGRDPVGKANGKDLVWPTDDRMKAR